MPPRTSPGTKQTLTAVFKGLDAAAKLVAGQAGLRSLRVDHLRMYASYLLLCLKVWEAAAKKDNDATVEAIKEEPSSAAA